MQESQGMELTTGKIVRVAVETPKPKDQGIKEPLTNDLPVDELLQAPYDPEDKSTNIQHGGAKKLKENVCQYLLWFMVIFFILGIIFL